MIMIVEVSFLKKEIEFVMFENTVNTVQSRKPFCLYNLGWQTRQYAIYT